MSKDVYELFGIPEPRPDRRVPEIKAEESLGVYEQDFGIVSMIEVVPPPIPGPPARFEPVVRGLAVAAIEPELVAPLAETKKNGVEIDLERIPSYIVQLAASAITKVLEITIKPRIITHQLADVAFGHSEVNDKEFYLFKQALRHDPRLNYIGDSEFEVIDRNIVNSAEDWMNSWKMDNLEIEEIKDKILAGVSSQYLTPKAISSFMSENGIYLLSEEMERLIYLLGSDERTKFNSQGALMIKTLDNPEKVPEALGDDPSVRRPTTRPMSVAAIRRTMQKIDATPEAKHSKDLAKNKADNRKPGKNRRKKGSKLQGRTHGQKKTIEQLIQEMHKNQASKS